MESPFETETRERKDLTDGKGNRGNSRPRPLERKSSTLKVMAQLSFEDSSKPFLGGGGGEGGDGMGRAEGNLRGVK